MAVLVQKTMLRQFIARPEEGAIIGRLLAGYGELEFFLHICVASALGNDAMSVRLLYRARGENQRIEIADSILRPVLHANGSMPAYKDTYDALHHCRKIRNQYAHCHWHFNTSAGLFFCNLDTAAQTKAPDVALKFFHIDKALLTKQEEYFAYCQGMLAFCAQKLDEVKGRLTVPSISKPRGRQKPALHNPPENHPLPEAASE